MGKSVLDDRGHGAGISNSVPYKVAPGEYLADCLECGFDITNGHFVKSAGTLLAVSADKRYGGAFVKQLHSCLDTTVRKV